MIKTYFLRKKIINKLKLLLIIIKAVLLMYKNQI
jgi:hypothetical protein